jgi:uncharacterized protein involved in exopolysaccharide biosynthesis
MIDRSHLADRVRPEEVTLAQLLAPVLARWRTIVAVTLAVGALGVGLVTLRATRYEAGVTVATISNSPSLQLGGAAALLAGGALAQSGFQPNPALVASLLESRRVLHAVGTKPAGPPGGRVVERVRGRPVEDAEVAKEMAKLLRVDVSRETGLVSMVVTHPDSALARRVADGILEETTRTFVQTARAQASQLRRGQEARVDSAARRLRRAQDALQSFRSRNRGYEEYAASALDEVVLQREVSLAENVYSRAVGDREGAIAKELEETPVVVVVDSLPQAIPPAPRYRGLVALLSVFVGFVSAVLWVLVADAVRRQRAYTQMAESPVVLAPEGALGGARPPVRTAAER